MTYDFLTNLYDNIMMLVKKIVVKREDMAYANSTLETTREWEEYIACVKGDRNLYNYRHMNQEVLSRFVSDDILGMCMRDRTQIPKDVVDPFIDAMNQYVIDHYVEHNEYYRMLIGIPALDDHDYIYVTSFSNIPSDVPIHFLSADQIAFLEAKGVIDKLIEKYPNKHYLRYLGVNSINLIEAHQAHPFQILRLGSCNSGFIEEYFRSEYHKARRYVMIEIYNRFLFPDNPLYEPMMGFLICCLAIRNALVPTEDMYLNFEEILNAILQSYGILQYFERLPFIYKKRLVLMLDKFYQNKGTDGVMIDICRLFQDENLTVYRYYMLKTNKEDQNGELIMDENPNNKYDMNFLLVDVAEKDIDIKEENFVDYESIVENDYLWQVSAEEQTKLMGEEFNLCMSKYISAQAAYDLAQLTYEVCFFINLLLSSRNNTGSITVTNMYATTGTSDCFTMIIFMLALMARRAGYDGNVIYEPKDIATLWRFNLEDKEDLIKEIIEEYELPEEIYYIFFDERGRYKMTRPYGNETANGMVNVYVQNREIFDSLCNAMLNTHNFTHYMAMMKMKQFLFQSALTQINFTKSDGTIAHTYIDILFDLDYSLYRKVMESPEEDLDEIVLYVMEKMEYMYSHDALKYLFVNTPNTSIALLSRYIRTTIEVFKASSVQLDTINVFFYLGEDPPIRVFDEVDKHKEHGLVDQVNIKDDLHFHKDIILEDYVRVMDKIYTTVGMKEES